MIKDPQKDNQFARSFSLLVKLGITYHIDTEINAILKQFIMKKYFGLPFPKIYLNVSEWL